MEGASSLGVMASNTKANLQIIESPVWAYTAGRTEAYTKDKLRMAWGMVQENIRSNKQPTKANGSKEKSLVEER